MNVAAEKKSFFNAGRRELLAKTLMTLVQIAFGAGLAGGFFLAELSIILKITGTIIGFCLFGLGIWTCPDRTQKGE